VEIEEKFGLKNLNLKNKFYREKFQGLGTVIFELELT
jgi:hypothetical protein